MSSQPSMRQVLSWRLRAWRLSRCPSAGELISRCGVPARRLEAGGLGLWQFPLQILDGTVHSIYVAVAGDRPVGAFYLPEGFVPPPSSAPANPPPPPAGTADAPPALAAAVAAALAEGTGGDCVPLPAGDREWRMA